MAKFYKIALYVRVSTEDQAENPEGSIKNQEARLRQMVGFKNDDGPYGEIVDVFIDTKSAKDTNRPELQRMLQMISEKKVNLVMATELSRITRSIRDFSEIWDLMKLHGCSFLSLRENVDTTTAAGEMVLYTMANLAQFERRQISERVSANFLARAQRGLYNGGPVPLGYRLIPEKTGYLEIDPESAETVKECFKTFLSEGTLSKTAKMLNKNGIKLKQSMQGGGNFRNSQILIENLYNILKNKSYVGLRDYEEKGEIKTAKAVWPAIIDETTFQRVQDMLKTNKSKKKPHSEKRWPYLLSGILFCDKCGDRLAGKSAWGRTGKIPYYEHALAAKRNATLTMKVVGCDPVRFRAEPIEEVVWRETKAFLSGELLNELLIEAKNQKAKRSQNGEREKVKAKIYGINGQIEALTERLSQLPKSVSATPIFKQMEKLEAEKLKLTEKLKTLPDAEPDLPVDIETFENFKTTFKELLAREADPVAKSFIIQKIVHKIKIHDNGITITFNLGQAHFKREAELAGKGSVESFYEAKQKLRGKLENHDSLGSENNRAHNFFVGSGSKSLKNGRGDRI